MAGLAAIVIIFMNRNYKTRFWPGATDRDVSTLWLMLGTAIGSVIIFWLLSRIRRVIRELSEMARERRKAEEQAAQTRRAEELNRQEKRIDEKLKGALGDENSQD